MARLNQTVGVFYHEEPPNSSKRSKFLSSALKEAFSNCGTFTRQLSISYPDEEENAMSDLEDEQEEVVSEIRIRAMQKLRKKPNFTMETFSCIFSPHRREQFNQRGIHRKDSDDGDEDEDLEGNEEFRSVKSCFTCCSSAISREAFLSVKTNFSRCSSFSDLEFQDLQKRSIIQEFCHCEGWPFGLCKKLLLLPPLPKSPAESWSWRRDKRVWKTPYI